MSVTEGITEAMASDISLSCPSPSVNSSLASSSTSEAASQEKEASQDPALDPQQSLTKHINAASKPYHSQLNRAILARLPLALPPQNEDPTAYAIGIRHLLPIYHAFETAWAKYVSVEPKTPTMEDFSMEEAVMLSVLIHLNLPQLARADRLRQDVAVLLGVGHGELDSWMMKAARVEDVVSAELDDDEQITSDEPRFGTTSTMVEEEEGESVVEEEDPEALDRSTLPEPDVQEYPALHSFVRHIQEVTEEKPHVLIAYSWVLYMALFNGGRWIRAQLSKARVSWDLTLVSATQGPTALADKDEIGLSFWHFDGAHDGEDLKDEFKARMRDVEPMLSDEQREDIVQESVIIFRAISRLVEELDEMVGNAVVDETTTQSAETSAPQTQAEPDDEAEGEPLMVRSHMLRPRWETPLGYLELLFQILLPVGIWQIFIVLARVFQDPTTHWPMLRWNWNDGGIIGQDG